MSNQIPSLKRAMVKTHHPLEVIYVPDSDEEESANANHAPILRASQEVIALSDSSEEEPECGDRYSSRKTIRRQEKGKSVTRAATSGGGAGDAASKPHSCNALIAQLQARIEELELVCMRAVLVLLELSTMLFVRYRSTSN
jgi:hypothetical protein